MNKVATAHKSLENEISRHDYQNAGDFFSGDTYTGRFAIMHLFSTLVFGHLTNSFNLREFQHTTAGNIHRLHIAK
jgi:hypothetical protein